MPVEVFNWMMRLKVIEREYRMVRLSLDWLKQQAQDDPHVLTEGLRFRDIETVSEHLEGTYMVRLFSEVVKISGLGRAGSVSDRVLLGSPVADAPGSPNSSQPLRIRDGSPALSAGQEAAPAEHSGTTDQQGKGPDRDSEPAYGFCSSGLELS